MHEGVQHNPPDGNIQKAEAHHGQTHHGAAAERDLETAVEAAHRRVGRTGRSISGGLHAYESGQSAEETAGQEGERHPGILHAEAIGQHGKQGREDNKNNDHHLVLLFEVSHGSLPDVLGDFFHGNGSFALLHHLAEENPREQERHDRRHGNRIKQEIQIHILIGLVSIAYKYSNISRFRPR